jgi:hypothetical protein
MKSTSSSRRHFDWALCIIDVHALQRSLESSPYITNLPTIISPIGDPKDGFVSIYHNGRTIDGFVLPDYSIVALPGQGFMQRMWVVIITEEIRM